MLVITEHTMQHVLFDDGTKESPKFLLTSQKNIKFQNLHAV